MSDGTSQSTGNIDREEVENEVPAGNPFREKIIDLRCDGESWTEIQKRLEAAWDMVDERVQQPDTDQEAQP